MFNLSVPESFTTYFMIFKWSEFLEISFFACAFYYFSKWLNQDKSKKLFFTFILFCSLFLISDFLELDTLNHFIFYFAPIFLTLFIFAHQNIIQRNFITVKNLKPAKVDDLSWTQELVKSLIYALGKNKDIICVIENHQHLQNYLKEDLKFNCMISKEILNAIFSSSNFDDKKIVFINRTGALNSINGIILNSELSLDESNSEADKALILASKTDAIYLKSSSLTRSFDIAIEGKILNNIHSNQVLNVLETYLKKNKELYEPVKKNTSYQQLNS